MKLFKIKHAANGFSHIVVPIIMVVAVGAIGTYLLAKSHAAANVADATGTPNVAANGQITGVITSNGTTSSASSSKIPGCTLVDGYCYYWVLGNQYNINNATGAQANLLQAQPTVGKNDYHSLGELWVGDNSQVDTVEIGWITTNNQSKAQFFVYAFIKGKGSCYNGCGFVPVNKASVKAGGDVAVGAVGTYKTIFQNNQWQVYYNGKEVGYYPESLWGGKFVHAKSASVYGEVVSSASASPKTQMGNGKPGTSNNSAYFSKYTLFGTTTAPSLTLAQPKGTAHNWYSGSDSKTSLNFGGSGS